MIILRQKSYAEEGEDKKRGLSKGAKVALGAAATTALAFAGAKGGMLGGRAQMGANKVWAQAGNKLSKSTSSTLSNLGGKMKDSGIAGYGAGAKTVAINNFASKNNLQSAREIVATGGNKIGNRAKSSATSNLKAQLG